MRDDSGAHDERDRERRSSAFADLLREYMWAMRRPPITANKLAVELGISRQTVVNWLNGATPSAEMLRLFHQRSGIALARLYGAAGYDLPAVETDEVVERIAHMTPEERERLRAALNAVDDYLGEHATDRPAPAEPSPGETLDATRDQPGRRKRDSGAPKVLAGAR